MSTPKSFARALLIGISLHGVISLHGAALAAPFSA